MGSHGQTADPSKFKPFDWKPNPELDEWRRRQEEKIAKQVEKNPEKRQKGDHA